MRKITLIFGSITGLICGAVFFTFIPWNGEEMNFEGGETWGYVAMIIALSTIFFATKQYKDKFTEGHIKFGKAFLIGLYVTLVASVWYVLSWELFTSTVGSEFFSNFEEFSRHQLMESGLTESQIEAEMTANKSMMDSYQNNTLFRMAITFAEIFPVGLIISLLSALLFSIILKPKPESSPSA